MKSIAVTLYQAERAFLYNGALGRRLIRVQNRTVNVGDFTLSPINQAGGPSVAGLPYLYSKLTYNDPSLNQEWYLMQTVAQMNAAINSGN